MSTKERIIEYLKMKGISKREFYRKAGVSNGFLDSGKEIGTDKVEIIMNTLPELNIIWALTGNGEIESNKLHLISAPNSAPIIAPKLDLNNIKKDSVNEPDEPYTNVYSIQLDRIESLSAENAVLKRDNAELLAINAELKAENGQLKEVIKQCEEEGCTHKSKAS